MVVENSVIFKELASETLTMLQIVHEQHKSDLVQSFNFSLLDGHKGGPRRIGKLVQLAILYKTFK